MKFGKQLEKVMDITDPEWGARRAATPPQPVCGRARAERPSRARAALFFVRYNLLKRMIKDIVNETGGPENDKPEENCCEQRLSLARRSRALA